MSPRNQKQTNINALKSAGFLKFEIDELTSTNRILPNGNTIDVPLLNLKESFVGEMVKARARSKRNAIKKGISEREFEQNIIKTYFDAGWTSGTDNEPDFWQMFRKWEDDYRKKHPEYPRADKAPRSRLTRQEIDEQKREKENKRFYEQAKKQGLIL